MSGGVFRAIGLLILVTVAVSSGVQYGAKVGVGFALGCVSAFCFGVGYAVDHRIGGQR